jgi:hypothetical protein
MPRAWIIKIGVILAVVGPPAIFAASRIGHTGTALERTLWDLGFYPIKPPSNLVSPGSIYHVTRDGKFYTTICEADQNDVVAAMKTSASEEMIARELQKTAYELGADAAKSVNATLDNDVVESVNYRLSSVSVKEIPLERNEEINVKLTTEREACRRVIGRLLQDREFVCQGQSVLVATVEYQLTSKASAKGKATITPDNAPTIKAALEAKVNTKIDFDQGRFRSGTGLHYGIKVNPTCMARPTDGARHLPRNRLDQLVNFFLLDVLRW